MTSARVEIALFQRHHMRLVPNLVAQIQDDDGGNDEVVGDEIEPGKHLRLKYADIGAEQHDKKQHQREPRTVRVELGLELQVIHAAALRHPGLAEAQMADGYPQPDEKSAQARRVVEQLVDL